MWWFYIHWLTGLNKPRDILADSRVIKKESCLSGQGIFDDKETI